MEPVSAEQFGAGSGQAKPRAPDSRQAPRPGPSQLLALAAAAAAAAVAAGPGRAGVVAGPESTSRPLFLPEETSFLGRTLTPVVSRGSPCGHLCTQWRCLCLPPIPSIRMSVSASAAPCPPPWRTTSPLGPLPADRGPPGWAEPCLTLGSSFCKGLEEVGGLSHLLEDKKGRLRESGK